MSSMSSAIQMPAQALFGWSTRPATSGLTVKSVP
jgi:hypothetical protein